MAFPSFNEQDLDQKTRDQINRLSNGCILLANEALRDPNFAVTVVLICVHNDDGAYGLVLNRPSHMPLSEMFDVGPENRNVHRRVYVGGPVRQETLQILQHTDSPVEGAYEVARKVHLGGNWESLEQILAADSARTRLFLGYSGWGANQLENEIVQGAWEVFSVDLDKFLSHPEDRLQGSVEDIRGFLSEVTR